MQRAPEVPPLLALVEAVEAVDKPERIRVSREHALTGDRLDAAAVWWREDPGAVDVLIDRLGEALSKGAAKTLAENIRRRAKEQTSRKGPRLVTPEDEASEPNDADLSCPWPSSVPEGWIASDRGVWRLADSPDGVVPKRLAYAGIVTTGGAVDVETGERWLDVAWTGADGWRRETVARRAALDAREVVALASLGAPVASPWGGELALYLAASESALTSPLGRTSGRLGWLPGGGFAAGPVSVGGDGPITVRAEGGYSQYLGYRAPSGTLAGWLAAWSSVSEHPIAACAVYAACAAPLLALTGCPSFLVDWSAEQGRGKTTALRLGASVWGRPDEQGLLLAWSVTPTFVERMAAFGCDLPLFLDETNRVPLAARPTLAQLIYTLANGQGKGRGTVEGVQQVASWRTVVLSTGEARLTAYTQDEGTRGRVISMTGPPLGKHGAERAEALRSDLLEHFGHVGPALIRWLVDTDRAKIKARYQEIVKTYADAPDLPTRTARRLAQYVALLDLTAKILHGPLKVPRPAVDPIAEVWRQVCSESTDADRPAEALRHVYEIAASRPTSWFGRHECDREETPRVPGGGWLGVWQSGDLWVRLAWISVSLRAELERAGHQPDQIFSQWARRGWLESTEGRTTKIVRLDGLSARCVVIRRSALIEVGAVEASRDDNGRDDPGNY